MECMGDQTKIHLNPDFIASGVRSSLKPKVHVNPAFLHKSQGTHSEHLHERSAPLSTGGTVHSHYWQGASSAPSQPASLGAVSHLNTKYRHNAKQLYPQHSKFVNYNRTTNSGSQNMLTKDNTHDYTKGTFSRQSFSSHNQHFVAKEAMNWGKHSSAYSWKAADNKVSVPLYQTKPVYFRTNPAAHSVVRASSAYQGTINKSTVVRSPCSAASKGAVSSQSNYQWNAKKQNAPSSSHSFHHDKDKNKPVKVKEVMEVNEIRTATSHISKYKSVKKPPSKATEDLRSTSRQEKPFPKVPLKEVSSKFPNYSDILIPKSSNIPASVHLTNSFPNNKESSSEIQLSLPSPAKSLYIPTVNADHKIYNTNCKFVSKISKHSGKYKVLSKTKLVRQHAINAAKSRVGQHPMKGGRLTEHCSKVIPVNSPRLINNSKLHKSSPAAKLYSAGAKTSSKRRYSVISPMKLVRSQAGKVGASGKPKYSVNTKTKLIRRRSDSCSVSLKSPSKVTGSKAKSSKPEEPQRKFHVISKTKIVRRRSNSGVYKVKASRSPAAMNAGYPKRQTIIKRHKLVRNATEKHEANKFTRKSYPRNVNTTFKVINAGFKLSAKQKLAKGIVSKYKINRLKVGSFTSSKKDTRFYDYTSKSKRKDKFKFQSKKGGVVKRSDRFINIGGILYKSTKTSLRKQLPKVNYKTGAKNCDSPCNVLLRGEKFHVSAGGRTLRRVQDGSLTPSKSSLPRVHIGGLTYSRTKSGLYELTKTHHTRAVLSSARQRSMVTLMHKRRKGSYQKRNEYCVFFNRFGRCSKKNRGECPYVHDPSRVAVCTRFLRGRCPVSNCPFSHTVDPDKMPVCSHFLQAACTREDCPYRHVRVNPAAPVCVDFVRGHCKAGEECEKQHILVCEEFKTTGKCPRGASCLLSHHKGQNKHKRAASSRCRAEDSNKRHSRFRKRKVSESLEILGGPIVKKRAEKRQNIATNTPQQRYFHLMTTEDNTIVNSPKPPEHNQSSADIRKDCKILSSCSSQVPYDPSKTSSKSSTSPQDNLETKAQGTSMHEDLPTAPVGTSAFEETRCRVLRKVDKIKKINLTSTNCNSSECVVTSDKNSMVEDVLNIQKSEGRIKSEGCHDKTIVNHEESIEDSSCIDSDPSISDLSKVQRPPLPKRLPSYIPLILDED